PLDDSFQVRDADACNATGFCRFVYRWSRHAHLGDGLADILLSLHLDFARVDFRAAYLLDGAPAFSAATPRRRLAHGGLAGTRRTGMRSLLGNVELLLVPEMDLSHPGRGILANFRNASAGLWRLHPLRAGTVHLEGLFLAQRTTACAG